MRKDILLNKLGIDAEEKIFKKFLRIENIELDEFIHSPFRDEKLPSCKFYKGYDNRLRFTDFGGFTSRVVKGRLFKSWDCFDLVNYIITLNGDLSINFKGVDFKFKCNINSNEVLTVDNRKLAIRKVSFTKVLEFIAIEFNITENTFNISSLDIINNYKKEYKSIVYEYDITHRIWLDLDYQYWKQYDIDVRIINQQKKFYKFSIYPVLEIINKYNGAITYTFSMKDPCYVYYLQGKTIIQFYFPKRNRDSNSPRFLTNFKGNSLFGLNNFTCTNIGIITKSYKDIFLLRHYKIDNERIQALSVPSEVSLMNDETWNTIRYYADQWYTLFDYDFTGISLAILYWDTYRIQPILFYKSKKLKIKEIKQLYKRFGIKLVKTVLQYTNNYDFIFNNLKGKDFSDNIPLTPMQNEIDKLWSNSKRERCKTIYYTW